MSYLAIILAAGKATRMGGKINKAFAEIGREKLIIHLINSVLESKPSKILCVINSNYSEEEKNYIINFIGDKCEFNFVYQEEQLGTGHALRVATDSIENNNLKDVIVFYADTPLIKLESIEKLKFNLKQEKIGIVCGFSSIESNQYGRIIFDENKKIDKIVEYKDYRDKPDVLKIPHCNSGIIGLKFKFLQENICKITNDNNAKEYYLFDLLSCHDEKFRYLEIRINEAFGINNFAELNNLEKIWQNDQREFFMKNFVHLIDKDSAYFAFNNKIGHGVTISQNVVIGKNVEIGDDVIIEPNVVINNNVKIGAKSIIKSFSHIIDSEIGEECEIGPFANINGQNVIGNKNIIGNFVEVKRSKLNDKNKAKHLAYIGDAEILDGNNFGAGSIICNYDGKKKHKTKIGNKNMIGANSSIIAPRVIGDNNTIAAGSVLTKDLDDRCLAVERSEVKISKKRDD